MELESTLCEGRYTLVEKLGTGGMGSVYRCYDSRLDTFRAIKLLDPRLMASESIRQRFQNEARAMARVKHRAVVTIHDVGTDGEQLYIVMELVGGGSLRDLVTQEGPLQTDRAIAIIRQVLTGLTVAHEAGIVHRDIKPANILMEKDGTAKLTDFGIARLGDGKTGMTRTGAVMGTWAYMPPEQRVDSKSVTSRSDLYATGATLYFAITGKDPFDIYSSETKEALFAGIEPSLALVIQRSTRYKLDSRYVSAQAMIEGLDKLATEVAPDAVSPGKTLVPDPKKDTVTHLTGGDTFELDGKSPLDTFADVSTRPPSPLSEDNASETLPRQKPRGFPIVGVLAIAVVVVVLTVPLGFWWTQYRPEASPTIEPDPVPVDVPVEPLPVDPDPVPVEPPPKVEQPRKPIPVVEERPAPSVEKPDPVHEEPDPVVEEPAVEDAPSALPTELSVVNSKPQGVQVSIDGTVVGKTAWRGPLTLGEHMIVLVHPDGDATRRKIRVVEGRGATFCWDFVADAPCRRR